MPLHRLVVAGVLLGLVGCLDAEVPHDYATECDAPAFIPGSAESAGAAGKFHSVGTVREPFASPIRPHCLKKLAPVWGDVRVTAPDGSPIAARLERNIAHGRDAVFEAPAPGWYRVEVGLHGMEAASLQRDVFVARPAAASRELTLPRTCPDLQRTDHGSWLCGSALIRDDGVERWLPEGQQFVSGNVVWSLDARKKELRRYEDTGEGELVLTHLGAVDFIFRFEVGVVPSADELVIRQRSRLAWFSAAEDGQIIERGSRQVGGGSAIAREGDSLLIEDQSLWPIALVPLQLLSSGEIVEAGPRQLGEPVSSGDSGLWTLAGGLTYVSAGGSAPVTPLRLPAGLGRYLSRGAPLFTLPEGDAAAPRIEGDEIVLEVAPEGTLAGATEAFRLVAAAGRDDARVSARVSYRRFSFSPPRT